MRAEMNEDNFIDESSKYGKRINLDVVTKRESASWEFFLIIKRFAGKFYRMQ